jgi:hypothetical protein
MDIDETIDDWGVDPEDHPLLPEDGSHNADDPPFMDPVFPHGLFNIRDQDGDEDGPFDPDEFVRDPDGVWYAQTEGRPVFLRVIAQNGVDISSLDGSGDRWNYTMIPLSGNPDNSELAANLDAA